MTEQKHSASHVWYAVLLLTLVNVVNYMDRMALAMLAPLIKADLELSDAQLGLLIGFAFAVFYAVCGIPIGRWADRGVRRNIIALALTMWSAMTVLSGAAQNFWHLLLARIGVGAGEAGSYAPGVSILCDYVPLRRRPGILALHVSGNAIGVLVGMGLAGWLGQSIGWRWTFVVLGIPGIALALAVRFTLREPVRGSSDEVQKAKTDESHLRFLQTLAVLWQCRTYRALVSFWIAMGFVQFGSIQWWPSFFARVFNIDLSLIGVYLGIAVGVGGGLGTVMGGVLANRLMQRDVRLPLLIGAVVAVLLAPAALGVLFVSSVTISVALAFFTALLFSVPSGPVLAAQYSVVSSHMRATAGAITIFFSSVLGFGLGSFSVGLLSDLLTPSFGDEALRYALLAPICPVVVVVVALRAASKALPADLKAAAGTQVEHRASMGTGAKVAGVASEQA